MYILFDTAFDIIAVNEWLSISKMTQKVHHTPCEVQDLELELGSPGLLTRLLAHTIDRTLFST